MKIMKISDAIRSVERVFINFPDIATDEVIQSFGIAIYSMEKQVPMKVVGRKNIYPNEYGVTMVEIKCPNCESFIEFESLRCYEPEYCDECGQKLNWED